MSDLKKIRQRVEIETIYELLDRLDYYQLLGLPRDAPQADVEPGYRSASRNYHPDRVARLGDKALSRRANTIYKTIGEANKVLKDPDKRATYDQELSEGNLRLSDEGRKEGGNDDPALAAKTEKGQKYWILALQQWRDGDYQGCVMNIQFALTFEKDNEIFAEYLDKAKQKAQAQSKDKKKNPYKLRLV